MKIRSGIYIILDPSMERDTLLSKLKEVIYEDIAAIQIWDNFKPNENPVTLINEILTLCHNQNIPVLINNQWGLLKQTNLDGIHLDNKQHDIKQLKNELNRHIITGITCNNDLDLVKWANQNGIDYLSFCSMFPSSTANSCEIVSLNTIHEAREITRLPIFLAGGIKLDNIEKLDDLNYSGIAVVSGIMNAENPRLEIKKYKEKIQSK